MSKARLRSAIGIHCASALAILAVLTLAPLAAITPASAAVSHPATPEATCTGGWQEVTLINYSNNSGLYVGSWHLSSTGVVLDSYSRTATVFCQITISSSNYEYAFREQGTSDCAAFRPSTNTVLMRGCDESSTNQQWYFTDGGPQLWAGSAPLKCLDGAGGDTDVFMNICGSSPDNQSWYTIDVS
jgi:hypothetical protein